MLKYSVQLNFKDVDKLYNQGLYKDVINYYKDFIKKSDNEEKIYYSLYRIACCKNKLFNDFEKDVLF